MNRKLLSVRVAPLLIGLLLAGSAGMASAATSASPAASPANSASSGSWLSTLERTIMCVVINPNDCSIHANPTSSHGW